MPLILSHVDLRVRDIGSAAAFYDAFLSVLGAVKASGERITTWQIPPREAGPDWVPDEWFGIVEDRTHVPNATRIAFAAPSRGVVDAIATILPAIGARAIEMPQTRGSRAYACFFEDPDGNRLEVAHVDAR